MLAMAATLSLSPAPVNLTVNGPRDWSSGDRYKQMGQG
jgi:hypothetical protein